MEKEKFERKKRNRRELASPEMFRQMQKKGVAETVSNVKVWWQQRHKYRINLIFSRTRSTRPGISWLRSIKLSKLSPACRRGWWRFQWIGFATHLITRLLTAQWHKFAKPGITAAACAFLTLCLLLCLCKKCLCKKRKKKKDQKLKAQIDLSAVKDLENKTTDKVSASKLT